jgi:ABC-type spermidine/putrescine transport system permease subunit II
MTRLGADDATTVSAPRSQAKRGGMWSRVSAALWRRPWAQATILLTPPLAWFVLIYLASLVVLLITAFWQINPFTTNIERIWSLNNFTTIFTSPAYRAIILRTVAMAAAVTVVDAVVAFPFAYFMARIASPRTRTALFVAILLPLWASYLAKVYSWLVIFTHDGILDWSLRRIGLSQVHLIYTNWAVFTVFCYLWLPFMIIPVYAALERIPASQIEASQDLGARTWRTTRLVLLPLALPGLVAGSIFTFSLTLGDYITPLLVGGTSAEFMGNVIYSNIGIANNVPFAAAMACIPVAIMAVYLLCARALGAFEAVLSMEPKPLRIALRIWVALVLAFLFIPIVLIVLYSFNRSNIESWPIAGFSLHWYSVAFHDPQVRSAFLLSVRVGLFATVLALLLGSAVAYALYKFRFFGREAISFLLVLPLALPGIITGIALNSFFSFTGIQLGTLTIVIGHTTFCIVVVFNNVIARLRRTSGSLAEASMDLGARGWQTMRFVTLPLAATALVSGALLAFGLSFDEVIVTVFTAGAQNTLPLWIFGAIRLGQQLPEVNAVVSIVILLTIIPVVLAARLAGAGAVTRSARNV